MWEKERSLVELAFNPPMCVWDEHVICRFRVVYEKIVNDEELNEIPYRERYCKYCLQARQIDSPKTQILIKDCTWD